MNPEVKEQWLNALRSDEYVQGRGSLRTTGDEFCCLGVLCDLAVKADVIDPPELADTVWYYHGDDSSLPYPVRFWAGLDDILPAAEVIGDDGELVKYELAELNDSGASFVEIADLIEEGL